MGVWSRGGFVGCGRLRGLYSGGLVAFRRHSTVTRTLGVNPFSGTHGCLFIYTYTLNNVLILTKVVVLVSTG